MACGQNPTPPKEIQTAFSKKFSSTQELKWEQEKNEWEAEFKLNGIEMSVSFDNSGKWIETESGVKKEDVPAQVFKSIALKFDGFEIDEIELEKEETEVEILFTPEGVITIK